MARKDPSYLGIDFDEVEIRVVSIRLKGGAPFVAKAAAAPVPQGSISGGMILEPGMVAVALRRLIDTMGPLGDARAVFGVPGDQVLLRTISVPSCLPNELPILVAGEAEHLGLLRTPGSAHGFVRLTPPAGDIEGEPIFVMFIAAQENVTEAMRETAERAGLSVEAFEPSLLGMLRAGARSLPGSATAFFVTVGSTKTDTIFLESGRIVSMRRFDVGSKSILQTSITPVSGILDATSDWEPSISVKTSLPVAEGRIDTIAVTRLAVETQRTMDYLQREYPEFASIDRVHLSLGSMALEPVRDHLSEQLRFPVELVSPRAEGISEAVLEMSGEDELRFMAAYGHAIYAATAVEASVPKVDLYSAQRTVVRHEVTKRNFMGSVFVSCLSLGLGAVSWYLYNTQIAKAKTEMETASRQTAVILSRVDQTTSERAQQIRQHKILRKEGVPLGPVMDSIVGSLEPGVGLKSVTIDRGLRVTISGEAIGETALSRTQQRLQASPVLKNLIIGKYERPTREAASAMTFQLEGLTVSSNRIKSPGGTTKP